MLLWNAHSMVIPAAKQTRDAALHTGNAALQIGTGTILQGNALLQVRNSLLHTIQQAFPAGKFTFKSRKTAITGMQRLTAAWKNAFAYYTCRTEQHTPGFAKR